MKFISNIIIVLFLIAWCFHTTFGDYFVEENTKIHSATDCWSSTQSKKQITLCCSDNWKISNSQTNTLEKYKVEKQKINIFFFEIQETEIINFSKNNFNFNRGLYYKKDDYINLVWITKSVC